MGVETIFNKGFFNFRLKTVNLVLKNTQGAEALVKLYETKLCEEDPLTADKSNIEGLMSTLKVGLLCSEK